MSLRNNGNKLVEYIFSIRYNTVGLIIILDNSLLNYS